MKKPGLWIGMAIIICTYIWQHYVYVVNQERNEPIIKKQSDRE
ncbi:hypothetical protein LYNGBM3L_43000 [Moorena producens 3L]|uniref:Uncharacterized protein n=1 Tax=Moorena producens 3L TaxID=489825 RepID=F4XWA9_9CYAN|nr:hypothetical protein LYNGBM3L_43000 [Moorena producens 3L]